ncbi:TetR/AcrR family transcriptional regulator [Glycomyces terrestris]|uniref:TetR/AcrR family transcriptional regulator n=1 Tax=Glycomyces terrestris TaxID=2493553 RepID=UPI001315928D|nr:TetR/AcrR family transcriptional regulator [Glycomyces terrestris]
MQSNIARTAEALFVAKGFEETTVDEIAAAVGMSQRSFFRYFPSKDEVVLDSLARLGEELAARLAARPPGESEWDSLRRAFDPVVERFGDPVSREHDAAIQRIIDGSPRLFASYLRRLEHLQRDLTEALLVRAGAGADPVVMRAMVGGAFACLHASAFPTFEASDEFGPCLDRTMAALRPVAAR